MATQRTSFAKLQRDRDRQAKAAAKRDRRQERQSGAATDATASSAGLLDEGDQGAELGAGELLAMVEMVHKEFEAKLIDFETFEERKSALLARLPVD
jgi:hypothetical protein